MGPIEAAISIGLLMIEEAVGVFSAASVAANSSDRAGGEAGVRLLGADVSTGEGRLTAAQPVSHTIDRITASHFMRRLADEKPGFWWKPGRSLTARSTQRSC
jgi:hypothetical protein